MYGRGRITYMPPYFYLIKIEKLSPINPQASTQVKYIKLSTKKIYSHVKSCMQKSIHGFSLMAS